MGLDTIKLGKHIGCRNCLFWIGLIGKEGTCIKDPVEVAKQPNEFCSNHPSFPDYAVLESSSVSIEEGNVMITRDNAKYKESTDADTKPQ